MKNPNPKDPRPVVTLHGALESAVPGCCCRNSIGGLGNGEGLVESNSYVSINEQNRQVLGFHGTRLARFKVGSSYHK